MAGEWQNIVTLAIVLAASGYLIRRGWRSIAKKRAGGCGACGNCSAGSGTTAHAATTTGADPNGKPLVQLQTLVKRRTES